MKPWILLLPLALAACGPKPTPAPPAKGPATVAVAKGVVEAEGGLVRIAAPREGVIEAPAQEGLHVSSGQVLARLDARQAQLQLDGAAAETGERRAQLEVATARAAGAAREAKRLADMAAADLVTRQEADQAATAAAVALGEQRQAAAGLGAAQARQKLAAYEVEVRTVRSPVSGRIVRRIARNGAAVAPAAQLFLVEPDGGRVIRAELDESFAERVSPGMHATVTREFQSGASFEAEVLRIADVLAGPALVDDAAVRADARVVSVILNLPPGANLRLGQRVLVRFKP